MSCLLRKVPVSLANGLAEAQAQGMARRPDVEQKVRSAVPAATSGLDLKAARCPYSVVYPNGGLGISLRNSMRS